VATIDELPLHYRVWMRTYPWRTLDPVPFSPLHPPLARARIALITSAGLFRPGLDEPFVESLRGDPTWRLLPIDTPPAALRLGQTSDAFDRRPIERDVEEAWPVESLQQAQAEGRIGSVHRTSVSFNGSMSAPGRFLRDAAPAIAQGLRKEQVDAALLVPV
jgi:hypothetical protein